MLLVKVRIACMARQLVMREMSIAHEAPIEPGIEHQKGRTDGRIEFGVPRRKAAMHRVMSDDEHTHR